MGYPEEGVRKCGVGRGVPRLGVRGDGIYERGVI